MVHVAEEMERRGLELPLLIGGATTSKQHTAVKIAPAYSNPTLHVLDASRVVGVVSDLLDDERRARSTRRTGTTRSACATSTARGSASRSSRSRRRARTGRRSSGSEDLPEPAFTGARIVEPDLATLRDVHRLAVLLLRVGAQGKFPQILDDPEKGAAARELYDDANELLDEIVAGRLLQARGVYGFWPARAEGDDIVLAATRASGCCASSPTTATRPNRSLADFVAPAERAPGPRRRVRGHGGLGADELAARFEAENDDYRAIMVKALADRLAEAFAEWLHEQARREWYETGPRLARRS